MEKNHFLIIIPCYNEEKRLFPQQFLDFTAQNTAFSFLFVDDGSKDNTWDIIHELQEKSEQLFSIKLAHNRGKAEAIRRAMLHAISEKMEVHFHFFGYVDADLSVPLEELIRFERLLNDEAELKFVMGVRLQRLGANIQRRAVRHYIGRIFSTLASCSVGEPVYDTQCGVKVIHQSLIPILFGERFVGGWLFDLELIFRIKAYFPKLIPNNQVLEFPLNTWIEKKGSKVKAIDVLKAPLNLFRVWLHYRSKK